jgi:hypothetical protein
MLDLFGGFRVEIVWKYLYNFLVKILHFLVLSGDEFWRHWCVQPYVLIGPNFTLMPICDKDHFHRRFKKPKLIVQPFKTDQWLIQNIQRIQKIKLFYRPKMEFYVLLPPKLQLQLSIDWSWRILFNDIFGTDAGDFGHREMSGRSPFVGFDLGLDFDFWDLDDCFLAWGKGKAFG